MKKIIVNSQTRNKPFLIVIYHSSLVKAAMNAACLCKLLNGVNKMPSISSFFNGQRRNEDHSALVNCGGIEFLKLVAFTIVNFGMKKKDLIQVCNEYSPQLSKLLYNWQVKNKEAL